jgi:hypothetical protein
MFSEVLGRSSGAKTDSSRPASDTASARAEYASALKLFPAHEAASNALKKLSRR